MASDEDAGPSCSSAASNAPKLEIKDKMRVLCLHGYRQNGDAFKSKIGSLRKFVSKYADFVFITAPHVAAPLVEGGETIDAQRSWWFNKADKTFKGTNKDGPAFGFEESLRMVEDFWKKEGPFQGLLGFSQGACFAALICGLAQKKITCIQPEFVVLASGFVSGSLAHKCFYEDYISVPSLHIYGTADEIIPKEMSQELAAHFDNVQILEHNRGHYLPATANEKLTYVHFFQDQLQNYLEKKILSSSKFSLIEEVTQSCDDTD